ncbi:TadE/TadG family type IV pilus assembly protein [Rhizobium sp. TH2]|uniref:TadE/TadG family type IV pilus assembly protein n=1 Tax=Rhizobium sp. TH2 TaxID=2775403 RepID=UPI0021586651|nr:TadE/TadG family type IV pilus assembly protein [Rhizobium sp. TH2]
MSEQVAKSDVKIGGRSGVFLRLNRAFGLLRDVARDRSGASAMEFAFLAPILLAIYISSFEITTGYSVAQKTLKAAGTIADIVTRQETVNKAFLSEMVDTAEATIAPSPAPGLKLKITGVTIDGSGNAKVLWSWDESGGNPYTKGSVVAVPDDMKKANSFLVRSELSVEHTMLLFFGSPAGSEASTRTININREFYYRERLGNDVPCSDCG